MNHEKQEYHQLIQEAIRLARRLEEMGSETSVREAAEVRTRISTAVEKMKHLSNTVHEKKSASPIGRGRTMLQNQQDQVDSGELVFYDYGESSPWCIFGGIDENVEIPLFVAVNIDDESYPELMIDVGTAISAFSLDD